MSSLEHCKRVIQQIGLITDGSTPHDLDPIRALRWAVSHIEAGEELVVGLNAALNRVRAERDAALHRANFFSDELNHMQAERDAALARCEALEKDLALFKKLVGDVERAKESREKLLDKFSVRIQELEAALRTIADGNWTPGTTPLQFALAALAGETKEGHDGHG